MKITVIAGHFQKLGDWKAAATLRAAGFTDTIERTQLVANGSDPNHVTVTDVTNRDMIVVYSHGLDSYLTLNQPACKLFVSVLGVPNDLGNGFTPDVDLQEGVEQAVFLHLDPNWSDPVSEPVKNLGGKAELFYDWGDPAGWAAITARDAAGKPVNRRINIKLDKIAKSPPNILPWTWGNAVWNHTHMENDPHVLAYLDALAQTVQA